MSGALSSEGNSAPHRFPPSPYSVTFKSPSRVAHLLACEKAKMQSDIVLHIGMAMISGLRKELRGGRVPVGGVPSGVFV